MISIDAKNGLKVSVDSVVVKQLILHRKSCRDCGYCDGCWLQNGKVAEGYIERALPR